MAKIFCKFVEFVQYYYNYYTYIETCKTQMINSDVLTDKSDKSKETP